MSTGAFFSAQTFGFLRDLAKNNRRDWFIANRARYDEHVRSPSLALIEAMIEPLKSISPALVADPRPIGGSLFQINRDMRFSKDKIPYKTHVGITFRHAAALRTPRSEGNNASMGKLDAPILYLQIEPSRSFIAGGIWRPQGPSLKRIREYMLSNPASWKNVSRAPGLPAEWKLGGESLIKGPAGYDRDHELSPDIRRRDFIAGCDIPDSFLTSTGLPTGLTHAYSAVGPLYDWLCGALDLEF